MNNETQVIKSLTPIKFSSENAFIIPNLSGITGNTDAKNKLDARYAVGSTYIPTNYRGTDFAGANPVKTLTHSRTLLANTVLVIGGRVMHRTVEYTISDAIITMVDIDIDDADYIMVCD